MSFTLGNHTIDEILLALATDFQGDVLYTVDQLSNATITITSDPREITDKNGNVVRRVYKTKNGEFASTSAFLHPALLNAGSGASIQQGTNLDMPELVIVPAGGTLDVTNADSEDTIKVIGVFGNGANTAQLTKGASPDASTLKYAISEAHILSVPAAAKGDPVNYVVKYDRKADGMILKNTTKQFPNAERLYLKVSYIDLCEEGLKPAIIYIPNFMPDPAVTINLSSENQEVDFNGTLQIDYCGGDQVLYIIYYPDEDLVETGVVDAG